MSERETCLGVGVDETGDLCEGSVPADDGLLPFPPHTGTSPRTLGQPGGCGSTVANINKHQQEQQQPGAT